MANEAGGLTLPYEILYILGARDNNNGLSSEKARELTGAILIQLRVTIRGLYGSGTLAKRTAAELMTALDLYKDTSTIEPQTWE